MISKAKISIPVLYSFSKHRSLQEPERSKAILAKNNYVYNSRFKRVPQSISNLYICTG